MTTLLDGIDVSAVQGLIDWNAVQASGLVHFAICKATEGPSFVDSQFKNNWNAIKRMGMVRGAYHFGRTQNDPVTEADHFVNAVKSAGELGQGDLLVLDIEVSTVVGQQFIDWVLAWCERVEQSTSITPMIYTGGPFFNLHGGTPDPETIKRVSHFPLWLAAYVVNPAGYIPVEWKDLGWRLWQRAGDQAAAGDTVWHLPGIHGDVDHDQFAGTMYELISFANSLYNASPAPVVAPAPEPAPTPEPVQDPAPLPLPPSGTVNASNGGGIANVITEIFKGFFCKK